MIDVMTQLRLLVAPVSPFDVARKADLIAGENVDYSLSPLNTMVRWVDGSQVWRRAWIGTSGNQLNVLTQIGDIPDFAALVRLDGYLVSPDGFRVPTNYNSGTSYFSVMIHEEGGVYEIHGNAAYNNRRVVLVLDYIPTPTDITTWDNGTTSWDNGGTVWDMI